MNQKQTLLAGLRDCLENADKLAEKSNAPADPDKPTAPDGEQMRLVIRDLIDTIEGMFPGDTELTPAAQKLVIAGVISNLQLTDLNRVIKGNPGRTVNHAEHIPKWLKWREDAETADPGKKPIVYWRKVAQQSAVDGITSPRTGRGYSPDSIEKYCRSPKVSEE